MFTTKHVRLNYARVFVKYTSLLQTFTNPKRLQTSYLFLNKFTNFLELEQNARV